MASKQTGARFQIVIPMSGFGERFRRKGYGVPKPLIEVDGLPIIAHVINLFPGETDFLFICNQDHLDNSDYAMAEILRRYCPTGRIVGIAPHKLGPVHAVSQLFQEISPTRPVIVNYCDFACYWDYPAFKQFVKDTGCDGAIPAYRGFHPHSLGSTFYAYLRERDGWISDIQEKKPFTDDPTNEFASSGTYYFSSGSVMSRYFKRALDEDWKTGDEYYASLVYKPMMNDGRRIAVYPLQHFMQWGTPEDLEEYVRWSDVFRRLADHRTASPKQRGTLLMPLAGAGSRFAQEGYTDPKPLIPVSGKPMVVQATDDLPSADAQRFILRRDLPDLAAIEAVLAKSYPDADVFMLDGLTDGQARTCHAAAESLDPELPLTIGACDNGLLYDHSRLAAILDDDGPDLAVWAIRGHPGAVRHPEMYGWLRTDDNGRITAVSVKQPFDDPENDPIVVGAFTFRKVGQFLAVADRLFQREHRINGEFYVDSCIEDALAIGLDCRIFEVDAYLCWGTPDELRTFEYWQSCFHKWPYHPYRLENDSAVPASALSGLNQRYASPALPDRERRSA